MMALSVSAVYSPTSLRVVDTVSLGDAGSNAPYVHYNNDAIYMYSNYTMPQRMCLYKSVETCVPPYPPTDVCDAVTPGCTCYRWMFAGTSNASIVATSDYTTDINCIDFVVLGEGTVDFYFEMRSSYPVLPDGLMFALLDGYSKWPLSTSHPLTYYAELFMKSHCSRDIFDGLGECVLKHTLRVLPGVANWKELDVPTHTPATSDAVFLIIPVIFIAIALVFGVHQFYSAFALHEKQKSE